MRPLARQAADPANQQRLRDALARATELGADGCARIVLLVGDGTGEPAEPIPWPEGDAVLFLERSRNERELITALSRAVVALTRWRAPDSHASIRRRGLEEWDRWKAAREVPLRDWIYADGIGTHLAQELAPESSPEDLLGLRPAAFNRLREREKFFRGLLTRDLDETGIGLLLRWLTPDAPAGPRTVEGTVLPPGAGRYLAWRMLAERVKRVGLREAVRLSANG